MIRQQNNKPYGFIYKTILPDGRFYIGQHKIISIKTLDPTYFGSGVIDAIKGINNPSHKTKLKRKGLL